MNSPSVGFGPNHLEGRKVGHKSPRQKESRLEGISRPETQSDSLADQNHSQQAKDLLEGLSDLLELHNSEELRALCASLGLEGRKRKQGNVELVLSSITPGEEEASCRKILRCVWDGIIIEYLRKIGKNLMKCRNNLRGAVLAHWKRHVVALAENRRLDETGTLPVYMKNSKWSRLKATSEEDQKVNKFLTELFAAESELKQAEKALRLNPDYSCVVSFLAKIHSIRAIEESFRKELTSMLQELLGERDNVLERERQWAIRSKASEEALQFMKKRETSTSFFRGLTDVMNRERVLETIRVNVKLVHHEKEAQSLKTTIENLKYEHMLREGQLQLELDAVKETLREREEALRLTLENLDQTTATSKHVTKEFDATSVAFQKYRADARAYIDKQIEEQALKEVEHQVTFQVAAAASARVAELERDMRFTLTQLAEQKRQNECAQMTIADIESSLFERGGSLRVNSRASSRGKGKEGKKNKKASPKSGDNSKKKKGSPKGKSPKSRGRSRSPTSAKSKRSPKSSASKRSKSPSSAASKRSKSPPTKNKKKSTERAKTSPTSSKTRRASGDVKGKGKGKGKPSSSQELRRNIPTVDTLTTSDQS